MILTRQAYERARRFVAAHGRALEAARLRLHFDGAPATVALAELARYQNADGGFGQALEPDLRIGASSALGTSIAFQVLREIGAPSAPEMTSPAIAYLLRTCDRAPLSWRLVPEVYTEVPQAPWWNQAGVERGMRRFELNPSAELQGYLCEHGQLVPPELLAALGERVLTELAGRQRIIMHDFLCCQRLLATAGLEDGLRASLLGELLRLLPTAVSVEPAQWAGYSLRPLQVADRPDSPFYAPLRQAVATNLDYEIATQQEDGSWALTWSWAAQYPDAWPQAAREWAGMVIVEKLLSLHAFGRIEGGLQP